MLEMFQAIGLSSHALPEIGARTASMLIARFIYN